MVMEMNTPLATKLKSKYHMHTSTELMLFTLAQLRTRRVLNFKNFYKLSMKTDGATHVKQGCIYIRIPYVHIGPHTELDKALVCVDDDLLVSVLLLSGVTRVTYRM